MASEREFDFGALIEEAETGADEVDVLAALLAPETDDPEAERRELSDEDLRSLEEEFDDVARLDAKKHAQEKALDATKRELAAAKERMYRAMELQGTNQFRSSQGLGSCYMQERFDTTVEDEKAFIAWIQEHHPELLSLNYQTRNRLIREEFRDKGVAADAPSFPPGIKVTPRPQLAVRGARPKGKGESKDSKA